MQLKKVDAESPEDIRATLIRLEELGIGRTNCYLYMQGHSVFNLVNRIGKALMDESFEQQVLMPSFTIEGDYSELSHP